MAVMMVVGMVGPLDALLAVLTVDLWDALLAVSMVELTVIELVA